jgi:hypothetical protein
MLWDKNTKREKGNERIPHLMDPRFPELSFNVFANKEMAEENLIFCDCCSVEDKGEREVNSEVE